MVGAALLLLALERLAPSERLLLGLPHADILESLVYAVSGTLPLFAVFGGTGPSPSLMPRGDLRFWVLVSILSSVILTVVLNLLLLF